jgi:putative oxidoreductase
MKSLHANTTENLHAKLDRLEARITRWLIRWSVTTLRVGLGSVFLGFGALKFFPGFSPAEGLVMKTLDVLTLGMISAHMGVVLVAGLECTIGLGLITGRFLRLALVLLGLQMIGAMSPLLLFPGELFGGPLHAPTLEGQYVLKDVVLVSAGLVIGGALQGGRVVSERILSNGRR